MSKHSFRVKFHRHVCIMDDFGNDVFIHYDRVNVFVSQSH